MELTTEELNDLARTRQQLAKERRAYVAGLRRLADRLEAQSTLRLPDVGQNRYTSIYFWFWDETAKKDILDTVHALGITRFEKSYDEDNFRVECQLDGLHLTLISLRKNVCTRRVIGKKMVEKKVATGFETRMVEEDDVIWDCPPILADEEPTPAS